jgi:Flp pilus assembly protein TadG
MLRPPIPRKLLHRRRRLRATARPGPERDRGSVAVFTAVFAIAVIFLTAMIMDGGIAMNARERAVDIAGQAARAAAGDIDVGALETTGQAQIGQGACAIASQLVQRYAQLDSGGVDKVDTATMVSCDAPAGSEQATIIVQITTQPLVGVLGGFTETGQDSAVAECGIAQGEEC